MKVLITGVAGFIGFHLAKRLIDDGHEVLGLDSINDYYDVRLKYGRLAELGVEKKAIQYGWVEESEKERNFRFIQLKLEDRVALDELFQNEQVEVVVNLAAQAGVRYSLINPYAYLDSNLTGFLNLLECARHSRHLRHFVYASSSSVYGLNEAMPFSTADNVDHPVSLYAATKKSNELMAHTYSHLFKMPTTGLRFFTVYGPWGRPDMALFLFTKAILAGEPIKVFNHGKMQRDFTYIDDIVEGITRIIAQPPSGNDQWSGLHPDPASSPAPYRIYNIGNNQPVELLDFIGAIEKALGKTAVKELLPIQPGDVPATYADVADLERDFGWKPSTDIETGIRRFVEWYKGFFGG
ncbi:MAG: NAD-dependent epimerase [Haliscomenobacter sp.]|nr:NAD-dependent epimerase [Haliscomenobacter sp.]